ncbi:hypothetical protein [Gordonibacter massiliensis (ex Traore et al. 2017)]|uniref:Uncharacterized protein n=1 Tax=Gordonibacter massiliensis (ex Traore et al. 2017) TaxID=1841863 RepID=A0A842J8S4_9ACTN|nr:hypothetical protein [Gordonibacter massiliensis (ex Traore et al. 2017)]MBC2888137.1 hypothetical protein [Gordonibacter massiliensis (ex Traore et al. 2017)]
MATKKSDDEAAETKKPAKAASKAKSEAEPSAKDEKPKAEPKSKAKPEAATSQPTGEAEPEAAAKAKPEEAEPEVSSEPEAAATPAKKEPKERTFVDAKTGETIAHPHQGGSGAEANKAVRDEMHAARNGSALPFRIGAIVLWVLGLVCEFLAVLVMNGTLFLPGPAASTWLVIFLVADLVLVVAGSQLWKHANHVAPASKENKVAYWVQTDLGVIIAAIAFAPIILLMLTNKDLDKGTKRVGTIVAAVALIAAVASGVDYHPATQEDRDQAEAGAAVLSDDGLAYWTPFGEVYHFNPDCQYIKNSGTIYSGTVQDAIDAKRTRGCSGCTVENGTDVLSKADPEAVAAALANVIKVGGDETGMSQDAPDEKDAGENAEEQLPKAA